MMARTKDALKILDRLTGADPAVRQGIVTASMGLDVAQMIYDARTKARLSQQQLAALIGSRQSVIARLEDAHYRGHSLTMLQRIGTALGRRLELRFVRLSRRGPRRAKTATAVKRALRRS